MKIASKYFVNFAVFYVLFASTITGLALTGFKLKFEEKQITAYLNPGKVNQKVSSTNFKSMSLKSAGKAVLSIAANTPTSSSVLSATTVNTLPHMTDFLTVNCCSHEFASMSSSQRANLIDAFKSRGYTHIYIYAYNENDYGGPAFDYYTNPQAFKTILQQIVNAGLKPVVWLNPDDAPVNKNRTVAEHKSRMNSLIPVIDSLVNSYVLGLELNEYWNKATADELGTHLDSLTSKPLAAHQTPGRWDYCVAAWCDYMVLQYGFGKTVSEIKTITKDAIIGLGKPVVAGEYNIGGSESTSISLGNAAQTECAAGFGNGGTPSNVKYPGCWNDNTPTPPAPTPTVKPTSVPNPPTATPTSAPNPPTATPTPNTSIFPIPGKIEAEKWVNMSGVQNEPTSDIGGGFNVGSINNGDWMDYNVNVSKSGQYTVEFRVSAQNAGGKFQVKKGTTTLLTVNIPQTGNYQNWVTVSLPVQLTKGLQTIRIVSVSNTNWNINWMNFKQTQGDADADGDVDENDYQIWLNHYNSSTTNGSTDGDFNSDNFVDGIDYVIWRNNYTGPMTVINSTGR